MPGTDTEVSTNAIAEMMETKASSVTDMLKKLAEKDLVNYKKYQGVSLTENGKRKNYLAQRVLYLGVTMSDCNGL